jgi:flagellar M-ring protein FliF
LPLGPKTAESLHLSAEQVLEEKLVSTLEPVTGPGNVRASVTLDYDTDAVEETKESYDPTQSATLSMQRSEQSTGAQAVAAGVPGTASNVPNSQTLPVYPSKSSLPETSKTESGTYGVSKVSRHMVEDPGKVRRLTAAIVVNDRQTRQATKNSSAQWQPRSPDELRNLTALAQAAVGFDSTRGDTLTVQDLAFEANSAQDAVSMPAKLVSTAENSPVLVKYVTLLAGLLILLAFGVRPALRRASAANALAKGTPRELPGRASAEGQLAPEKHEPALPDPERLKAQEVLEQVTGHLKREPAQSSRLLQSWIHSD